jgi:hypothetical protein
MTLEEKIEVVKQNKDACIAALESVIDTLLNVTDPVWQVDKDGNLDLGLKDKKALAMAIQLREDVNKYDPIRLKLKADNFDLDKLEIAYISIAFFFCGERARQQIAAMEKAKELSDTLYVVLNSKDEKSTENEKVN